MDMSDEIMMKCYVLVHDSLTLSPTHRLWILPTLDQTDLEHTGIVFSKQVIAKREIAFKVGIISIFNLINEMTNLIIPYNHYKYNNIIAKNLSCIVK